MASEWSTTGTTEARRPSNGGYLTVILALTVLAWLAGIVMGRTIPVVCEAGTDWLFPAQRVSSYPGAPSGGWLSGSTKTALCGWTRVTVEERP